MWTNEETVHLQVTRDYNFSLAISLATIPTYLHSSCLTNIITTPSDHDKHHTKRNELRIRTLAKELGFREHGQRGG